MQYNRGNVCLAVAFVLQMLIGSIFAQSFTTNLTTYNERLFEMNRVSEEWLNTQRFQADSFTNIVIRRILTAIGSDINFIINEKEIVERYISACDDVGVVATLLTYLSGNATAAGAGISGCGGLSSGHLQDLVSQHFYSRSHELQQQSLAAKSYIFVGLEVFNPLTNQEFIDYFINDLVQATYNSFNTYVQGNIVNEVFDLAVEGQRIVDLARDCADYFFNTFTQNAVAISQRVTDCLNN